MQLRKKNKDRFAERAKTKWVRLIILVLCPLSLLLTLTSCGTKKKVAESTQETKVETPAPPAWHTCLIQNARVTVNKDGTKFSSSATMQTVRDSMLIISVTPLFGMELYRLEATPLEIVGIDKIHCQYAKATYADVNRKLTPELNWDVLQELCSAELPLGSERARLIYSFGDDVVELLVEYTPRQLDVPVRIGALPLNRYTQVDISRWL